MRWYVNRGGDTVGPVEEAEVVAWVRGGMTEASVRDELGGGWMPIAASPFASQMPAGAVATIIPYKNKKALLAYYFGVFAIIPGLAFVLGPLALVFGLKGRRYAIDNPQAKGAAHAWAGIILGGLTSFFNYGGVVFFVILAATR